MTWFKVDDTFHSHPKVLAASPAALGLWVVAGSWSGANLSDGLVPDHVLPRLLPDAEKSARELVAAGLWKRVRGGYKFHDWTDFNPAAKSVHAEREAARERMRAVRARRKESGSGSQRSDNEKKDSDFEQSLMEGRENADQETSAKGSAGQDVKRSPEQHANVRQLFGYPDPTRPEDLRGRSYSATYDRAHAASEPPAPQCPEHLGESDPPPCGRCADARRARVRWDHLDAERRRTSPKCRSHRGQPAGNCALCRSEQLAAEESS